MTTDADPEMQAAITEALRIVTAALQASPRRYCCVSCNRLYTRAQVVAR
jgi:hypothetical protein